MKASRVTKILKQTALQQGFTLVGACSARSPAGYDRFVRWLEAGYAGRMDYMTRHAAARQHPRSILEGVRSLLMLGLPYRGALAERSRPGFGRVAAYAQTPRDYHDGVRDKLRVLRRVACMLVPGVRARGVVDTAPLLEREFALLAGLGWIGKNTLLINRHAGSWFYLAALLLDCPLEYDPPQVQNYCGHCTACLDACPTGALVAPGVLDARRCISYLTIELRDTVDRPLRPAIGDWWFGCDICQQVCPWNRKVDTLLDTVDSGVDSLESMPLEQLFAMDETTLRARLGTTPLWRARRRGLLRNAAIVLGNQHATNAVPALRHGGQDTDPVVREACAWALAQIEGDNHSRMMTTWS